MMNGRLAGPGSYCLLLEPVTPGTRVAVGAIGKLDVQRRLYVYLGSARGPGGLAARLGHHLGLSSAAHWHMDYLRRHCRVRGSWVRSGRRNFEHLWSQRISALPQAEMPLPGFGASDCGCTAHLVSLPARFSIRAIGAVLKADDSGATLDYLSLQQLRRMGHTE